MGVVAASVVGGWGSGETAPPQPSAGLAETADDHTITADAATQAEERNKKWGCGALFRNSNREDELNIKSKTNEL